MSADKLIAWFHENYEPGRPYVLNRDVREHYEQDTNDYTLNLREFPQALRDGGLIVDRNTGRRLQVRGWKRKAGA